jgi:5-formyltetrahydrofolate cyclo-ligase
LARRDALDPAFRAHASRAVADRALALDAVVSASRVAGFWPIRTEIDPRPLMLALAARGARLALPVVDHPLLRFRAWRPGKALVSRGFGLSEPGEDVPEVAPDVFLVPLAAFDRRGGRIGYGKGHYDRALAAARAARSILAIGLAFAVQEVASVPVTAHDEPLDIVVTERETIVPMPPSAED